MNDNLIATLATKVLKGQITMAHAKTLIPTKRQNPIKDIKFFEGGNAIFTVGNDKGDHYTFKIRKPRKDTPFFVSMLTGPDNNSSYSYIGLYIADRGTLRLTAKSKVALESTPVKVFNWAIKQIKYETELPTGYSIQHEGQCCRCGRKLTTPESIEYGIGPECRKKM